MKYKNSKHPKNPKIIKVQHKHPKPSKKTKQAVTERVTLPNGTKRIIFKKSRREFEPRFAGVNIPRSVNLEAGLCLIFGIGRAKARKLLKVAGVDLRTKAGQLSPKQIRRIREAGTKSNYKVESGLKRFQHRNIKRMRRLGTAKGRRHRVLLPVRGQRTRCNARTRKESRKPRSLKIL